MALPDAWYVIFDGNKTMGRQDLPEKLQPGAYSEYLRGSFILHEVLSPFTDITPGDMTVLDSGNYFYLTLPGTDPDSRQLKVDKDSYLPVQAVTTYKDKELDLAQIQEVSFYYDVPVDILPDPAFTPDHYLSLGYTLTNHKEGDTAGLEEADTLSSAQTELLLHYPFITAEGDTIALANYTAGYIVLDFWYSSCEPCLKALPVINQLAEDYATADLRVIGINGFNMHIRASLTSKLRAKNITIPLLYGSQDLIQTLGIRAFPTYILITPDRQVQIIPGSAHDVRKIVQKIFDR